MTLQQFLIWEKRAVGSADLVQSIDYQSLKAISAVPTVLENSSYILRRIEIRRYQIYRAYGSLLTNTELLLTLK